MFNFCRPGGAEISEDGTEPESAVLSTPCRHAPATSLLLMRTSGVLQHVDMLEQEPSGQQFDDVQQEDVRSDELGPAVRPSAVGAFGEWSSSSSSRNQSIRSALLASVSLVDGRLRVEHERIVNQDFGFWFVPPTSDVEEPDEDGPARTASLPVSSSRRAAPSTLPDNPLTASRNRCLVFEHKIQCLSLVLTISISTTAATTVSTSFNKTSSQ